MKIKLIAVLMVFAIVSMIPSFAMAQDQGQADTVIILTSRPEAGGDDSTFVVEIWVWNDMDDVAPQIGFKWDSEILTLDSAVASSASLAVFQVHVFWDGDKALSNTNNRAMYAGVSFGGQGLSGNSTRKLVSTHYFTISSWDALSEIVVDSAGWDDGSEMLLVPTGSGTSSYTPVFWWGERGIHVLDPSDIGDNNGLPAVYELDQNYPNPFNPSTTINFSLETAGDYSITFYNVIGQVVHEINGLGTVGSNTELWNATDQASGVYFYKLEAGTFTETKKMMLVK